MNLKKVFAILLLLLIAALFSLSFTGCSSLKKNKQKTETKTSSLSTADSSGTITKKVDETIKQESKTSEEIEASEQEVNIVPGQKLKVEKFDKDGKSLGAVEYSGSGSIKNSKSKTNKSETKSSEAKIKSVDQSKVSVKKKSAETAKASTITLDKEKKGFSFFDYIFWLLLILLIIVLIYLNYRFKWVSRISNYLNIKNER